MASWSLVNGQGDVRLRRKLQRTEKDVEALTENVWRLAGENAGLRRLVGLLADALTLVPTLVASQHHSAQTSDRKGDDFCAAVLAVQLWLRSKRRAQPGGTNN